MAVLRLFAAAREAAGTGRDVVDGSTVGEVLDAAVARYGPEFAAILERCKVWRNGDEAARDEPVEDGDEVAVLPPVSGGAGGPDPNVRWIRPECGPYASHVASSGGEVGAG